MTQENRNKNDSTFDSERLMEWANETLQKLKLNKNALKGNNLEKNKRKSGSSCQYRSSDVTTFVSETTTSLKTTKKIKHIALEENSQKKESAFSALKNENVGGDKSEGLKHKSKKVFCRGIYEKQDKDDSRNHNYGYVNQPLHCECRKEGIKIHERRSKNDTVKLKGDKCSTVGKETSKTKQKYITNNSCSLVESSYKERQKGESISKEVKKISTREKRTSAKVTKNTNLLNNDNDCEVMQKKKKRMKKERYQSSLISDVPCDHRKNIDLIFENDCEMPKKKKRRKECYGSSHTSDVPCDERKNIDLVNDGNCENMPKKKKKRRKECRESSHTSDVSCDNRASSDLVNDANCENSPQKKKRSKNCYESSVTSNVPSDERENTDLKNRNCENMPKKKKRIQKCDKTSLTSDVPCDYRENTDLINDNDCEMPEKKRKRKKKCLEDSHTSDVPYDNRESTDLVNDNCENMPKIKKKRRKECHESLLTSNVPCNERENTDLLKNHNCENMPKKKRRGKKYDEVSPTSDVPCNQRENTGVINDNDCEISKKKKKRRKECHESSHISDAPCDNRESTDLVNDNCKNRRKKKKRRKECQESSLKSNALCDERENTNVVKNHNCENIAKNKKERRNECHARKIVLGRDREHRHPKSDIYCIPYKGKHKFKNKYERKENVDNAKELKNKSKKNKHKYRQEENGRTVHEISRNNIYKFNTQSEGQTVEVNDNFSVKKKGKKLKLVHSDNVYVDNGKNGENFHFSKTDLSSVEGLLEKDGEEEVSIISVKLNETQEEEEQTNILTERSKTSSLLLKEKNTYKGDMKDLSEHKTMPRRENHKHDVENSLSVTNLQNHQIKQASKSCNFGLSPVLNLLFTETETGQYCKLCSKSKHFIDTSDSEDCNSKISNACIKSEPMELEIKQEVEKEEQSLQMPEIVIIKQEIEEELEHTLQDPLNVSNLDEVAKSENSSQHVNTDGSVGTCSFVECVVKNENEAQSCVEDACLSMEERGVICTELPISNGFKNSNEIVEQSYKAPSQNEDITHVENNTSLNSEFVLYSDSASYRENTTDTINCEIGASANENICKLSVNIYPENLHIKLPVNVNNCELESSSHLENEDSTYSYWEGGVTTIANSTHLNGSATNNTFYNECDQKFIVEEVFPTSVYSEDIDMNGTRSAVCSDDVKGQYMRNAEKNLEPFLFNFGSTCAEGEKSSLLNNYCNVREGPENAPSYNTGEGIKHDVVWENEMKKSCQFLFFDETIKSAKGVVKFLGFPWMKKKKKSIRTQMKMKISQLLRVPTPQISTYVHGGSFFLDVKFSNLRELEMIHAHADKVQSVRQQVKLKVCYTNRRKRYMKLRL